MLYVRKYSGHIQVFHPSHGKEPKVPQSNRLASATEHLIQISSTELRFMAKLLSKTKSQA